MSGSTVTYTATGTCVVDANQAGNDTYADAPQVQRTIVVTMKPRTTVRGAAKSASQDLAQRLTIERTRTQATLAGVSHGATPEFTGRTM